MQPANLNLTVYKGSTFYQLIQWKTGKTSVTETEEQFETITQTN